MKLLSKMGVEILTETHVSTELLKQKIAAILELLRQSQFRGKFCNMGYHCLHHDNIFGFPVLEF
jgi:hypothetical protein